MGVPGVGLLSLGEPSPAGYARAEAQFLQPVIPGDAGVQDEQAALQHLAVIQPLAARVGGRAGASNDLITESAIKAESARAGLRSLAVKQG